MIDKRRTLDEWQTYIGLERPGDVTRGLVPVRLVAERLGVAGAAHRNVVVAGTNGKGSTAVFCEALLCGAGLRVGTTLSPHLAEFNERIRVDGQAMSDDVICRALAAVDEAREGVALSYFEYATLAAFWVFKRSGVDATVLEVGLGGRLDAVNLADSDVAVITSIGIDHQELLGTDRESIGAEKAGILRRDIPLVFGETDMPASIAAHAARMGAPVFRFGRDYNASMDAGSWCFAGADGRTIAGLALPRVAVPNAATALQAARLLLPDVQFDRNSIDRASARARLAGRFQHVTARGRTFVLDVAHNPHGAAFLAAQLRAQPAASRTVAIAGFLKDKDAVGVVRALAPEVHQWWFVDTVGERAQSGAAVIESLERMKHTDGTQLRAVRVSHSGAASLDEAMEHAVAATATGDRILVVGSFNVVQRASAGLLAAGRAV
jgi:dihydrofolate synthase / folylpolyglutamate synthase